MRENPTDVEPTTDSRAIDPLEPADAGEPVLPAPLTTGQFRARVAIGLLLAAMLGIILAASGTLRHGELALCVPVFDLLDFWLPIAAVFPIPAVLLGGMLILLAIKLFQGKVRSATLLALGILAVDLGTSLLAALFTTNGTWGHVGTYPSNFVYGLIFLTRVQLLAFVAWAFLPPARLSVRARRLLAALVVVPMLVIDVCALAAAHVLPGTYVPEPSPTWSPAPVDPRVVKKTTLMHHPTDLALEAVAGQLWITNYEDGLSVLNTSSLDVHSQIATGQQPSGIALDSAGHLAFIANWGDGTASVVSTTAAKVLVTAPAGDSPAGIALDATDAKLFVTNRLAGTVTVLDRWTLAPEGTVTAGTDVTEVLVDNPSRTAYAVNSGADSVTVIDAVRQQVVSTIPVGGVPEGAALDTGNHRLYVANSVDDTVSVIDTQQGSVSATISVGRAPHDIAIDPDRHAAYVTNASGQSISTIDTNTLQLVDTINLGENPSNLVVDPYSHKLFVLGDSTLMVVTP